jgi:hypothetical protein
MSYDIPAATSKVKKKIDFSLYMVYGIWYEEEEGLVVLVELVVLEV